MYEQEYSGIVKKIKHLYQNSNKQKDEISLYKIIQFLNHWNQNKDIHVVSPKKTFFFNSKLFLFSQLAATDFSAAI